MWLFVIFVAIPLIEIGLFVQVGGLIGLWPTLGIVLVTAVVGTQLVRREGAREMANLRRAMNDLSDPAAPLAHGAMILLAGALLVTPGFFTDTLGILLLIRPVREAVMRYLRSRINVASFTYGANTARPRAEDDVIDLTAKDVTQRDPRATHEPSGWTRH